MVQTDQMVLLVLLVLPEQDTQDQKVTQVQLAPQVFQDQKEIQVHKVYKV